MFFIFISFLLAAFSPPVPQDQDKGCGLASFRARSLSGKVSFFARFVCQSSEQRTHNKQGGGTQLDSFKKKSQHILDFLIITFFFWKYSLQVFGIFGVGEENDKIPQTWTEQ